MNPPASLRQALLGICCLSGVILSLPTPSLADVRKGQTAYVACKRTPVHPIADAISKPIGMASYGQRGLVVELAGFSIMPESQQPIKKNSTTEGDREKLQLFGPAKQANWALLEVAPQQRGYIAISCLVEERVFLRENASGLSAQSGAAPKANRGFSEKENGDLVAMRGATGQAKTSCTQSPKSGRGWAENEDGDRVAGRGSTGGAALSGCANFKAIDEQLSSEVQYDPFDAYEDFRREGGIGEFKK